jgi:hypothetical protein
MPPLRVLDTREVMSGLGSSRCLGCVVLGSMEDRMGDTVGDDVHEKKDTEHKVAYGQTPLVTTSSLLLAWCEAKMMLT